MIMGNKKSKGLEDSLFGAAIELHASNWYKLFPRINITRFGLPYVVTLYVYIDIIYIMLTGSCMRSNDVVNKKIGTALFF